METPPTTPPSLPWCPGQAVRQVFAGRIRDGKFGRQTAEVFQVWECEAHRLGFLHPFPPIDYTDESYRVSVNDSAAIEQYFALHAAQQPGYLELIRPWLGRGQTVADFGCGGGALLDLVQRETGGVTCAIEPFQGYHASLASRGHRVFPAAADLLAADVAGRIGLALSIHVIEHTVDPVAHLAEIRRAVKPGGHLVVLTPNWDDFLLRADPARMAPFFYRRVHNYYFTAAALNWTARLAGWEPVRDLFYHEFGLANALLWLRDGRPAGHTALPGIDDRADQFWRRYLEETGQANNLGLVLRNPSP